MQSLITFTVLLLSVQVQAAFKIKPGLWEIETQSKLAGKESQDVNAQMQEAMKKMNPAQRAQMEKMMGSHGMGFGNKGMKICHTDKTMSAESMVQDKKDNCTITDKQEFSDGVKFNIKCDKGNGSAEYRATSDSSYTGWNEFETAKGKNKIEFKGKFLSANCGNIKPINEVTLPKPPIKK